MYQQKWPGKRKTCSVQRHQLIPFQRPRWRPGYPRASASATANLGAETQHGTAPSRRLRGNRLCGRHTRKGPRRYLDDLGLDLVSIGGPHRDLECPLLCGCIVVGMLRALWRRCTCTRATWWQRRWCLWWSGHGSRWRHRAYHRNSVWGWWWWWWRRQKGTRRTCSGRLSIDIGRLRKPMWLSTVRPRLALVLSMLRYSAPRSSGGGGRWDL